MCHTCTTILGQKSCIIYTRICTLWLNVGLPQRLEAHHCLYAVAYNFSTLELRDPNLLQHDSALALKTKSIIKT